MDITFWGVRGSIPAPLPSAEIKKKIIKALKGAGPEDIKDEQSITRYVENLPLSVQGTLGGNTSCVEVKDGHTEIIIDAGTGLRQLGTRLLLEDFGRGTGTAHILLSHFHWDHIQGLPFFVPAFIGGNRFFLYSPRKNFKSILNLQQNPNNFPVELETLCADIRFVEINEDRSFPIDDVTVSCIRLNHPGESYAYRLESKGKSMIYATDSEYETLSPRQIKRYVQFFSGCDLLIFDSMFTPRAAEECKGWGHSTADMGVNIALEARVKKLVLYHHEPTYDDEKIEMIRDRVKKNVEEFRPNNLEILIAYEGLKISL